MGITPKWPVVIIHDTQVRPWPPGEGRVSEFVLLYIIYITGLAGLILIFLQFEVVVSKSTG